MANLIRAVACVAVLLGLIGEISLGLFLPSHVKIRYSEPQASHLVRVDLPPVEQAAQWCASVQSDNHPGGQFIDCNVRRRR